MQLYFKRYNESGPPLVMLHGLFGSWDNLGAVARALTGRFQVYSLDMRNHGQSPHADSMTLAEMAEDVRAFLDAQGLDRVNLLGHSLGGKVMMELALAHPLRVDKLVVADIAPVDYRVARHDGVFEGMAAVTLDTLTSRGQADRQMAQHVTLSSVRSFLLKNLQRAEPPASGYRWRHNLPAIRANYRQIIAANRDDSQFAGPVLFIKGELSDYLQADYRGEVVRRFPNARVKVLSGTGHWLHAEKPELFAKLVLNFLA